MARKEVRSLELAYRRISPPQTSTPQVSSASSSVSASSSLSPAPLYSFYSETGNTVDAPFNVLSRPQAVPMPMGTAGSATPSATPSPNPAKSASRAVLNLFGAEVRSSGSVVINVQAGYARLGKTILISLGPTAAMYGILAIISKWKNCSMTHHHSSSSDARRRRSSPRPSSSSIRPRPNHGISETRSNM